MPTGRASRTEKYLGACAAGKWVLRKTYLEECRSAHRFVWEEDHEWGSGSSAVISLDTAPRRWRLELTCEKTRRPRGAFAGWKVMVFADKGKLPGLKRLLEAGGASIVSSYTPSGRRGCTHAFITMTHFPSDVSVNSTTVGANDIHQLKMLHCLCNGQTVAISLVQFYQQPLFWYYY